MGDSICDDSAGASAESFLGAGLLAHVERVVDGVDNFLEYVGHVGMDGADWDIIEDVM